MEFTQKIDVLDLLIDLLKEHENRLDALIEKMEIIDQTINKNPRLSKSLKEYDSSTSGESQAQSILVVDDDKNLANSFKLILERVGYNVDTAYTGLQALYKMNITEYDLVLLDLNLPDMMGDKVAEEIEEHHSQTDIVFITGYSTLKTRARNPEEKETMIKPIDPEHLLETAIKKLAHK
jgi:CheY-like chemotaxis protein